MNVKQVLIGLGGIATIGLFAYLTASGYGVQPDEWWRTGLVGGLMVAAVGSLVWVFRD
jgi:hypothetical protein